MHSPLRNLANDYHYAGFYDWGVPAGKDGFLATNSLIALFTILIRCYEQLGFCNFRLVPKLPDSATLLEQISAAAAGVLERGTWNVLFGSWGTPAAIDLESKCTEAALRRVQLADYRNFGHGRHHWLAKRADETGIVAIITPDNKVLAEKTLNLFPKNVPILRLEEELPGPAGAFNSLIKILHLVHLAGSSMKIDPGRPGVPDFGRQLYHIRGAFKTDDAFFNGMDGREAKAISYKLGHPSICATAPDELLFWREAYHAFTKNLFQCSYGAVVLDYDGTLCDVGERWNGLTYDTAKKIIELLEKDVIVGIATGRGRSARIDLQRLIPETLWKQLILGYYNGSQIGGLDDNSLPLKSAAGHSSLDTLKSQLVEDIVLSRLALVECRPEQITVKPHKNIGVDEDKVYSS